MPLKIVKDAAMKTTHLNIRILMIIGILFFQHFSALADNGLTDKERLIKLETKVDEGFKSINKRHDDLKNQIQDMKEQMQKMNADLKNDMRDMNADLKNDMRNMYSDLSSFMYWGFGLTFTFVFGGMISIVGFILWDRRTFIKPLADDIEEVKNEQTLIKYIIISFANQNDRMAKFSQQLGIQSA